MKMKKGFLLSALLALVPMAFLVAQDAGDYRPENQSHFDHENFQRSPFWPIGWYPSDVEVEAPRETRVTLSPNAFTVTSILGGDPPLAVINRRDVTVGDRFPVQVGGRTVTVTVSAILDGLVIVEHEGEFVEVPLRRGR